MHSAGFNDQFNQINCHFVILVFILRYFVFSKKKSANFFQNYDRDAARLRAEKKRTLKEEKRGSSYKRKPESRSPPKGMPARSPVRSANSSPIRSQRSPLSQSQPSCAAEGSAKVITSSVMLQFNLYSL